MRASRSAFRAIVYAVLYAFCNDYFYLLLIMYLKLKGLKCTRQEPSSPVLCTPRRPTQVTAASALTAR